MYYKIFGVEPQNINLRHEKIGGSDIAKELGISRAAVSSSLKRSLEKIYFYLLEKEDYSPYDTYILLSRMLTVCYECQEEVDKFWELLPENAKRLIENDAKTKYKNTIMC